MTVITADENAATDMRGRVEEVFTDPSVRSLAQAAERGRVQDMEKLLAQGVEVNAAGRFGITPLWWAIRTKSKKGFAFLLTHGACPNPKVSTITVMEMAAGYEDSYYLETILPYKPDLGRVGGEGRRTPLEAAIFYNRRHHLELLIKAGADLNSDDRGSLPLEQAVYDASYDLVYILLQAGADPTAVFPPRSGSRGKNRLVVSIAGRRIDPDDEMYVWRERVIAFLNERGIPAHKPDNEGPRTKPLPATEPRK